MAVEYAARLPNARRIVLPDAGHLSSMEAPGAFLSALRTSIG
jgi:pimeloyl-ACP methyl ester carboxylesterase